MDTSRRGDFTAMGAIAAGSVLGLWWTSHALGLLGTPVPHDEMAAAMAQALAPDVAPSPTSTTAQEGVAFYASSLGSGWSFEGDYSGRLTWNGSGLEVDLPMALVRREADDGHARLVSISLALAEDTDSGWRVVRGGIPFPVDGATRAGIDTWMHDVRLKLDGVTPDDLEGRWLVIEQRLEVRDAKGRHTAWTYAHADRALLPRLMGGILDGC